jgi:hypothetical protein
MPRSARIDKLLERVESLEGEVRDIRESIAPRERLRRVVERVRQRTKHPAARVGSRYHQRPTRGPEWTGPRRRETA